MSRYVIKSGDESLEVTVGCDAPRQTFYASVVKFRTDTNGDGVTDTFEEKIDGIGIDRYPFKVRHEQLLRWCEDKGLALTPEITWQLFEDRVLDGRPVSPGPPRQIAG